MHIPLPNAMVVVHLNSLWSSHVLALLSFPRPTSSGMLISWPSYSTSAISWTCRSIGTAAQNPPAVDHLPSNLGVWTGLAFSLFPIVLTRSIVLSIVYTLSQAIIIIPFATILTTNLTLRPQPVCFRFAFTHHRLPRTYWYQPFRINTEYTILRACLRSCL